MKLTIQKLVVIAVVSGLNLAAGGLFCAVCGAVAAWLFMSE